MRVKNLHSMCSGITWILKNGQRKRLVFKNKKNLRNGILVSLLCNAQSNVQFVKRESKRK